MPTLTQVVSITHLQVPSILSLGAHPNDAAHLQTADNITLNEEWSIGTAPPATTRLSITSPNTLPVLYLSAQAGYRINAPDQEETLKYLPMPELAMYAGARSDTVGKIGDVRVSATASEIERITGSLLLSDLRGSARTGIRCNSDLKLSDFRITMSVTGDLILTLDKSIPGIELTATATTPYTMTLSKTLPPLTLSTTAIWTTTADLSGKIPALKISADFLDTLSITLSRNLPVPDIISDSHGIGHVEDMTVNVNIPTLLMAMVGTGSTGDGVPEGAVARRAGQFTSTVLRHSR